MSYRQYEETLIRNINDVGIAILERKTLSHLKGAGVRAGINFFTIARAAMVRDMITRVIGVLDKERRRESFWYLYRCERPSVIAFANTKSYHLHTLDRLFSICRSVQDSARLRVDKQDSFDPDRIWSSANVTGEEFARALDQLWDILRHLYHKRFGEAFPMPDYDGSDIAALTRDGQMRRNPVPTGFSQRS